MDTIPASVLAASVGLFGGLLLGLASKLGDFCTLTALEQAAYGGDQKRLRMWGIVLGTAILASFCLDAAGIIALTTLPYHSIAWNPVASIFGGLIFGYGMAMAGNCGFSALARLGGGDLRSFVIVLVIGIVGFMTMNGPFAEARVLLFPENPSTAEYQGYAHLFADLVGIPPFVFAAFIASGLIVWALSYAPLRQSSRHIFWGIIAGLAIVSAFWGTTWVNYVSFDETNIEGHTFTAPLGRTLLWMMTSSAGGISFSVGSVVGVLVGAFLGSVRLDGFRWEACEDPRELGRQIIGAAFMGVGGVIALGCTIGQGVSSFSTLAYSAPITLAAICIGALWGLKHMLAGFEPE